MNKQTLKAQAIAVIDAMAPELRELSLFLHSNPELGREELQALSCFRQLAHKHGFTWQENISGYETAFIATKGTGKHRIAFLAEYDALPGIGHACGHNLIGAMSWGAAVAFAAVAGDQAVSCCIGCPAEETDGAKVAMAADGVFDGLTAAMIIHPADVNAMGGTSYATHPLEVTFRGQPAHVASKTYKGVNALDALVIFYQALPALHRTFTEETILPAIITKGGTAPNIVPAEAAARLSVRALSAQYLEDVVLPAVNKLAAGVASATGTTVETVHYEPLFQELINDPRLVALYQDNMALLGEKVTVLPPGEADGSTDVGNVSHIIPTIHPEIAIGTRLAAHTPAFADAAGSDYAQQRLLIGVKAMVMTAIDLLEL